MFHIHPMDEIIAKANAYLKSKGFADSIDRVAPFPQRQDVRSASSRHAPDTYLVHCPEWRIVASLETPFARKYPEYSPEYNNILYHLVGWELGYK